MVKRERVGVLSFLTDGRHGICTTGGYDLISLILRNRFFIGLHRWLDTHALYLNRTTAFLIYWCVVCALYNIRPRLHRSFQVQNGRLTVVFYGIVLFPHIDDMANSPHSRYVTCPAIQFNQLEWYNCIDQLKCVVKSLTCSCCCWMGSMHGEKANGGNEVAVTPMQQFVVKPSSLRDSDANWLPPKRFRIEMKTRQFRYGEFRSLDKTNWHESTTYWGHKTSTIVDMTLCPTLASFS